MDKVPVTVHIEVPRADYDHIQDGMYLSDLDEKNQRFGEVVHREVGKGLHAINARLAAGEVAEVQQIEITLRNAPVAAEVTAEAVA